MIKAIAAIVGVLLLAGAGACAFLLFSRSSDDDGRLYWTPSVDAVLQDRDGIGNPGAVILSSDWDLRITVNEIEDGVKTPLHTFHFYPEDHALFTMTPVSECGHLQLVCKLACTNGHPGEIWTMPVRHCQRLGTPSSSGSHRLQGSTHELQNLLQFFVIESLDDCPHVGALPIEEDLLKESRDASGGFITLDITATRPVPGEARERARDAHAKAARNSLLTGYPPELYPILSLNRIGQDETVIGIDATNMTRGGAVAVAWGSHRQPDRPFRTRAYRPGERTELAIPIDPRHHTGDICVFISHEGDAGGKYGTRRIGYLPHVLQDHGSPELHEELLEADGHFHPEEPQISEDGEDLVVAIYACGHDVESDQAFLVLDDERLPLTACTAGQVGYRSGSEDTLLWKIRWRDNRALQAKDFVELLFRYRDLDGGDWTWHRYSGIGLRDLVHHVVGPCRPD